MNIENSHFSSMAMNGSYHIVNRTIHFSFFLKELNEIVERQFRRHFLYAKEFMLKQLQKRHLSTRFSEIRDLLIHLHTPIVYAYVLCGGIIMSLLAIPFVCCAGTCLRKGVDPSKQRCRFSLEILFHVLSMVCLMIGIVGAYQVILQLQDMFTCFPLMWRNMVEDFSANIDIFKTQVHLLAHNLEKMSSLIIYKSADLPTDLINAFERTLKVNMSNAIETFRNSSFTNALATYNSGFIMHNNSIEHLSEVAVKELHFKIDTIYTILRDINHNHFSTEYNVTELTQGFQIIENYITVSKYNKYPVWRTVYDNLQMVIQDLLPAAQNSTHCMDYLHSNIKMYFKTELNRVISAAKDLQELCAATEAKVARGIKELFPDATGQAIINATYKVDKYFSLLDETRNSSSRLSHWNTWIMLIPPTYALLALLFLISASVCATGELKKIISNTTTNLRSSKTLWIHRIFRISMVFSISFLWAFLLLTAIFYCAYLPLSVFCEVIKDRSIITYYVDNTVVWNNQTWLDYKLHRYLPQHEISLKMRDLLDKCYHNKSVYSSLNMQEYWNVSNSIRALNLVQANSSLLHTMAAKAISEINMPDECMNRLIKQLATIEENLDLHFVPTIVGNFSSPLFKAIAKSPIYIPENVLYYDTRLKLTLLAKEIQNVYQNKLAPNFSKLKELKRQVKKIKAAIYNINTPLLNFSVKMQKAKKTILPAIVSGFSNTVQSTTMQIEKMLQNNIEDIGNCYVLPFVYDQAVWSACDYGLPLITGMWISLGIISVSMALSIILSCRIVGYINGANNHRCVWRQHVESQRYSSQTAKLHGTIIYDQSGNFMGTSITIRNQTRDESC